VWVSNQVSHSIPHVKVWWAVTSRSRNWIVKFDFRNFILGGSTCAPVTFSVSGPKFTKFLSPNVGAVVVDHLLFLFSI